MSNILYLLNHKTLTDFEVPLLVKKGYGVYLPKKYNSLAKENSINYATVSFYDNFLHIQPNVIIELNSIDWFSNVLLSPHIITLINENFKCIFITLLTKAPLLNQLIAQFTGTIYYRFFGLDGNKSYYGLINGHVSPKVKYIFSYPEIYHFEKIKFFNDLNSYIIPLGLSNSKIEQLHNTYNRTRDDVAFVCSRISKCPYYGGIYKRFIANFKDIKYIIYGKDNEAVTNDKCIVNNLPDDTFYTSIAECSCIYYHAIEPRHLHYHPLEAIVIGIPIIFHRESLLSSYLHESVGKCDSIEEAILKIKRIVSNDKLFIEALLREQNKAYHKLLQCNNTNIFDGILS